MAIIRYFTADTEYNYQKVWKSLKKFSDEIIDLKSEKCYHVEMLTAIKPGSEKETMLRWLLKSSQEEDCLRTQTNFSDINISKCTIIEIGPRFNFSTPFSTNCVNICKNIGLTEILRLEISTRYCIFFKNEILNIDKIIDLLSDRMTEYRYTKDNLPSLSFNENLPCNQETWCYIPLLEEGRKAIENVNERLGLAFTDWDLDYYTNLFKNILKRNPTTVELFDCAQSNSEHSRHWFFRGKIIIDGVEQPKSLIRMIMDTQENSNPNNTIKFTDNSSAIEGFKHKIIKLKKCDGPDAVIVEEVNSDLIFTAETHNMPTAIAPFSGATTGTGGRLRDVQGVGRGGVPIAGTVGYCVGCLNIPGWEQPFEDFQYEYPPSFDKPLKILIEASNGASDYGNKFGEPVITGFVNSYGIKNAIGQRDEYVKPIMFSGGLGIMDASMRKKIDPQIGMLLAKIGGPVYRIGVGGGAASSVDIQGSNSTELDFNAVQRGDPEMENKLNRVVRACIEMGQNNPILAIHDQGAGGNGNVLKELVEPGHAGAIIFSKEFHLGDPTITVLELWGAEYQENNAILCKIDDREILEKICERERCPISFVGIVTGDGYVTLIEEKADFIKALEISKNRHILGDVPFDLQLKHILGDIPKREYNLKKLNTILKPLEIPKDCTVEASLEKVFNLVSVGSKRYLTNKVDRCVTGLVVQQQCVGPLHTPLADYGLTTVSHFTLQGIATSIGVQPIKGLLNTKAMARMSVAEALTNLVCVKITELADIKCSGNWMWAAKLPGEGAKMYEACEEMCQIMKELHIAIDGGKDSLSMASNVVGKTVKSPGTLVISAYAPCPNVNVRVTPDLKGPSRNIETFLIWINIENKFRLGGSALAQVHKQQGNECPNLIQTGNLVKAFNITQNLLKEGKLLSGHDISEGGLIVCILEMALGGISGLNVDISNVFEKTLEIDGAAKAHPNIAVLFAEECGWVCEIESSLLEEVMALFATERIPCYCIAKTTDYGIHSNIKITSRGIILLNNTVKNLYKQWERVSFEIEKLQSNYDCACEEYYSLNYRTGPKYMCTVNLKVELILNRYFDVVRVAVLREEGTNSDREMMYCLLKANFEVHDVTMSDLIAGKTSLDKYQGIVFPGGFSYGDTLGSAKGWAANIMFSEKLFQQFMTFKKRKDTFSLGICNGCQLMSLIGWVGNDESFTPTGNQILNTPAVVLTSNKSGRFECRWATVKITQSKSIMLRNMHNWVLGCWTAHGEGRFTFKHKNILTKIKEKKCVSLKYVDDNNNPTEVYPMNPNGSPEGIAGICSEDGRHLALMPHPERCSSMHLWPYISPNFNINTSESPWQLMFNNAYKWCVSCR